MNNNHNKIVSKSILTKYQQGGVEHSIIGFTFNGEAYVRLVGYKLTYDDALNYICESNDETEYADNGDWIKTLLY